jgi:hypothetical protein
MVDRLFSVEVLGVRYKFVNFGAKKELGLTKQVSPDRLRQS